MAEPRDTLPPWPEQTLGSWGFDKWYAPQLPVRAAVGIESAQTAESWSGYALVRDGLAVSPVALPMIDPNSAKTNFTTTQGTVRFWFRPDWSSASAEGQGPGSYARLLELVSLSGNQSEIIYSLYASPDGNAIYLSGQGVGGPVDFLQAKMHWMTGKWHLVALTYDENQTVLFVDALPVATGPALPPVAWWKQGALGLVIGSEVTATNSAQGQFDELCTFEQALETLDLVAYWKAFRRTAALGPLGTPEEEQAKLKHLRAAAKEGDLPEFPGDEYPPIEEGPLPYTSPSYPSNSLWLSIESVSNNVAYLTLHGTVPDTMYEIQSQENFMTNAGWQSEGTWLGAVGQNWTPATVTVAWRTNKLFLRARSCQDSTGSGMPDWWQMQYFEQVGVDGYADPDGDGWNNIQEYQNGTHPKAFNTPAAPQGLTVKLGAGGAIATLNWLPASGSVTGYTIERALDWGEELYGGDLTNVSAGASTFIDDTGDLPTGLFFDTPKYRVQALYTSGSTAFGDWASAAESLPPQATTVLGVGTPYVTIVSSVPPTAVALRLGYWSQTTFDPPISVDHWDVPVASIINNTVTWTSNMVSSSSDVTYARWVSTNNVPSAGQTLGFSHPAQFWDGRVALLENLRFLVRAANTQSAFNFLPFWEDPEGLQSLNFANYAFTGLYGFHVSDWYFAYPYRDEFLPFRFNYAYRNFAFATTNLDSAGHLDTGVRDFPADDFLILWYPQLYNFSPSGNQTNIPTILATNLTRWTYFSPMDSYGDLSLIGISQTGTNWTLSSDARNIFGLRYLSVELTTDGWIATNLPAGGTISANFTYLYPETEQPTFENAGYYFCQPYTAWLPGRSTFSPTNIAPPLVVSIGQSLEIAGYAKLRITNGNTNKFAYLGQYFDKAYKANTSGTRSTNETGWLSPYGDFFATDAGKTFLTTKPDGVSTNIGECVVNVIKLQLDVNHDGTMNTSWSGPDNTSQEKPFVFWVNNDYDRSNFVDHSEWEEDDLATNKAGVIDADYQWILGAYAIPCKRDLEDYTRLWLPGLAEFYAAHSNLSFVLSVRNGDTADGPAINILHAVEANGGTNYLFNETMADLQVATLGSFYGRVKPGQATSLNALFQSGGPTDHFIFCGARRGKGELVLTIKDGTNVLAETAAWIQLKDIKEMYERWTVGEIATNTPMNHATNAVEDLPVGVAPFQYSQPAEANTSYILHVHGSNMERWEKDRFAETMYKRLYWQGYQGRFGSFRWPTAWGVEDKWDLAADASFFDRIEFTAWKSAPALKSLLTTLNTQYPGQVRMSSHSMGNVVAAEALKQCTSNLVAVYASFQGAVPSHSYDSNAPTRSLGLANDGTPNAYANYWLSSSNSYFANAGGAVKYVNFYNTNDYVLAGWQTGQDFKPDETLTYAFDIGTKRFWHGVTELYFPTNTYELFSFVIEARCFALGAQNNVGGVFTTTNQVDVNSAFFEFGRTHKGHSGEFRSTNMKRSFFWETLLIRMELKEE